MERFVTISFGPDFNSSIPGEYWNRITRHNYQRLAEKDGLSQLSIAGTFGYVVLKETEDDYVLVDEMGAKDVKINRNHTGTYRVYPKSHSDRINELLKEYSL
jgi:predicted regulator of Ras-like GTPase activity (Roadblock/LC7/MglB family)